MGLTALGAVSVAPGPSEPAGRLRASGAIGPWVQLPPEPRVFERRLREAAGVIRTSFSDAARQLGLSDALVVKFIAIFGWEIDFALDPRPGDRFALIYEELFWQGERVGDGDIVAAEFASGPRVLRAIRHIDTRGRRRYFTPQGYSVRRAFLRTPIRDALISSRFARRRLHPVLGRWRAHRGVDYAAPVGTPVIATADGRVRFAGRRGGYGNVVIIEHGGGYSTLYAHLARIRPDIRPGVRVRQAQVIGLVGSTGLASGPHLHYEFRVHGVHVDPLRVRRPPPARIEPEYRQVFFEDAPDWVARLQRLDARLRWAGVDGSQETGNR